jgi:hypothetical protein
MMEVLSSCETSILTRAIRRNIAESNINRTVPFKAADPLERELNAFMTAIQEAAWNSTPLIKTKLKGLNFPKEIRNLVAKKRKPKRKWHQSRIPRDKNLLSRVNNYPWKSKLSSNHQLTSSSQNSLETVALSILFGKLQNI